MRIDSFLGRDTGIDSHTEEVGESPVKLSYAFGQSGRSGLKDVCGLDLIHVVVSNSDNIGPPVARFNEIPVEADTAPGSDDHLRVSADDLARIYNPVFGQWPISEFRKDWLPAGDLNQLFNPSNAADERVVPFFEEDPRPRLKSRG